MEERIESNQHISTAHVKSIFVWMGRELESIDEAPAGTVIGQIFFMFCLSLLLVCLLKIISRLLKFCNNSLQRF